MPLLPITITFGRPSRPELLLVVGALLLLGSPCGWLLWAARLATPPPTPVASTVPLTISSTPSGATVLVDDQPRGLTLATVDVVPGPHVVTFQASDAIAETRPLDVGADGAHLDVSLWRA
ncbi:MAG: PEGA domain-containing protein, partial [Streptosporangiaceae bacterium]